LAVLGVGDHHLDAVVADALGQFEALLDPRGEHGGGRQPHRDPTSRVLVAARIALGQAAREALPARLLCAAGACIGLAGTVARRTRALSITTWAHGSSSGLGCAAVSMPQGGPPAGTVCAESHPAPL